MNLYFGHPTGQAADLSRAYDDPDHDGIPNVQEFTAGTDPRNVDSSLRLQVVTIGGTASGTMVFNFQGTAGNDYSVQYAEELRAAWQNLTYIDPLPSSGTVWVTKQIPPGVTQRFYRVVTPGQ